MTILANIRGQAADFFRPLLANVRRILLVEPLGIPTQAHAPQLTDAAASAEITLDPATERLSFIPVGGPVMYQVGQGSQTAGPTTHYCGGERLDIACEPGSRIAFVRATGNTATTTVYISELE